jgi:hypothetical protein
MKTLLTPSLILIVAVVCLAFPAASAKADLVAGLGTITATGNQGTILTITHGVDVYNVGDLALGTTKIYDGAVEQTSTWPAPGADDFSFNQTVHSTDGITHLETIFAGMYDTFFVFENGGNDDADWAGINADNSLRTAVSVDASATAADTTYNTGIGNQDLKGYVFTTEVPVKGLRITAQGFDAYSISAVIPEPVSLSLLVVGGLCVVRRRRRR